ncbi:phosphatase PAP2 family protein [Maribacter cobaltidurans]|uniref:hypothetical protein n=1 Tax=Maribacter cobaltidurans TaxID=1178778 RepID=UPI001E3B2FBA|nr:hypothetical protein [Maribacter cobaltidurans]
MFSTAASEVLAYIFPEKAILVRGWAEEAAISRVYGRIHCVFDATVGTETKVERSPNLPLMSLNWTGPTRCHLKS